MANKNKLFKWNRCQDYTEQIHNSLLSVLPIGYSIKMLDERLKKYDPVFEIAPDGTAHLSDMITFIYFTQKL